MGVVLQFKKKDRHWNKRVQLKMKRIVVIIIIINAYLFDFQKKTSVNKQNVGIIRQQTETVLSLTCYVYMSYLVSKESFILITPRPDFLIKHLPLVLILIIADQILNGTLCCSNKYN